jgi:hypothetical protein
MRSPQVRLVRLSGIYEVQPCHLCPAPAPPHTRQQHYNPFTGVGYGARGLGMSTLVCDWLQRL